MPEKRSIVALDLPGITPGSPPTRTPEVTWIDPCELLVDGDPSPDRRERLRA